MLQTILPGKKLETLTVYSQEAHHLSVPIPDCQSHPSWTVLDSEVTSDSDDHGSINDSSGEFSELEDGAPPQRDISSLPEPMIPAVPNRVQSADKPPQSSTGALSGIVVSIIDQLHGFCGLLSCSLKNWRADTHQVEDLHSTTQLHTVTRRLALTLQRAPCTSY